MYAAAFGIVHRRVDIMLHWTMPMASAASACGITKVMPPSCAHPISAAPFSGRVQGNLRARPFSGAAFACWVAGPMCDSHRASSDTNSYSFCTCGNPQCRHYAVSGQATVLRVAAESVWSIAACATPRPCARVVSALCAFSAFSGGLRVYLLRAHLRASEALCL